MGGKFVVVLQGWYDLCTMDDALRWAQRLGLAIVSPFFPLGSVASPGHHCAMLDGRRASFACSTVDFADVSLDDSKNWQWSADLSHHVLISPSIVQVRSGRDPICRQFQRDSVETRLEEFLTFLDSAQRSALPDVISFLVNEFRTIWGAGTYAGGQDALAAFLFALQAAGETDAKVLNETSWQENVSANLGIGIPGGDINPILAGAQRMQAKAPLGLRLVPGLVLRHAAGRLFQEAHAVVESVQLGLFGDNVSVTSTATFSPAGAYFTPVPIARLLAEWALQRVPASNDSLTIADYACGSAVFLTEALRALERRNVKGKVRLIGRDRSAQAIMMAKVAVNTVRRDMPDLEIIVDISQADALEALWPEADVVLMNPPFRSWERMDRRERSWVHDVTHNVGRPDLSVGFVEHALRSLKPSGVLATLLPAGVLASETLSKWRDSLTETARPSLIAVLGEHGLFQHALVNIGVLVLEKGAGSSITQTAPLHVAWSSAESGSASQAIRAIRRLLSQSEGPENPRLVTGWSVRRTTLDALRNRPSWLPGAAALGALLETIQTNISTRVGNIFEVRQGIRTGANEVFVQPEQIVTALPKREQVYFKKAIDAASFVDGEIVSDKYLFVPDKTWTSELDVKKAVPQFFNNYLQTRKDDLKKRKRKSQDPNRWWELTWPRFWAFDGRPRLVSKRFGLYPAFARDLDGSLAVVQANAWIPIDGLGAKDALKDLLTAYWWMLNSRIMVALFREYCPNVAGGQLDLENKYVKHVPVPDLRLQFQHNPELQLLAASIRTRSKNSLPDISSRDQFAAVAFGTNVSEWNLSGLELSE
jgi:SAM-dependent methyltransferase